MNRRIITTVLICALAAGAQTAHAGLAGVGIGAFVGANIPVAQDDAESGVAYGLRAPIQALGMLRLEPWFGLAKLGDYTQNDFTGPVTFPGPDVTTFGLNVMVGAPIATPVGINVLGGIGSYKIEFEGYESETRVGWNLGLDLSVGLGMLPIGVSGRAEGIIVPLETGGSRKSVALTVGAFYKLGI